MGLICWWLWPGLSLALLRSDGALCDGHPQGFLGFLWVVPGLVGFMCLNYSHF